MKKFISLIVSVAMLTTIVPVSFAVATDLHEHTGYKFKIADFHFEDLDAGTTISKNSETNYDSTNTYYMSVDTITISEDDALHGKVAQFTGSSGKKQGIGISKDKIQRNPDIVKVEVELKREENNTVYLLANGLSGGMEYELMLWSWNEDIKFSNGGTRTDAVGNATANEWCKITLYFDFTEGKREYCAYINDSFAGTYTIPSDITGGIKEFYVTGQTTVSVDNLTLYTLPDEFEIKQVTPADGATNVAADTDVVISFSNNLADSFDEDAMISVVSDGNVPGYSVTPSDNTITIAFEGDLDSKEDYTVILDKDIQDIYEQKLGEDDVQITFETAVYLSESDKIDIRDDINGALDPDEMEEVLNSADYKEKMGLENKYYTDNIYNTLYEQKPYETYEEAVAMMIKADSILSEINNAQSSDYTEIFTGEDGDIILYGAQERETYSDNLELSEEINSQIKESSPFADFKSLRIAFDDAVKEITSLHVKSYDYNRVIFMEDFEGDSSVSGSFLKPEYEEFSAKIKQDSSEHGEYLDITTKDITNDIYFRINHGNENTPIWSQCKLEELKRVQVSIDVCPVSQKNISVYFYDKYSNSSKTKSDSIISVNKDGYITFLNSTKKVDYVLNKWLKFDVFFDFTKNASNTPGTYTLYMNGKLILKDMPLVNLTTCVDSVGILTGKPKEAESYSVYLDNFRIAIPQKFEIKSSLSIMNANVADSVRVEFSNELPESIDVNTVEVTSTGNVPSFTVDRERSIAVISFNEPLDFGTQYTLKFKGAFCDLYGQSLGEDKSISITTIPSQFTASLPEFSDKVRSRAVNPTDSVKTAALVVVKRNIDGTSTIFSDEKTVATGSTLPLEVNFNADSLNEGESVYAFVTDGIGSLNLIREEYVSPEKIYNGNSAATTLSLTKTELVGKQLDIAGKLSGTARKNVVISLIDSNNTLKYAFLMQTNEKGEFAHTISVDGFSYGTYYVCVTGYSLSGVNRAKVVYLSDGEKEQIKNAINGAGSITAMEAVLKSSDYKDKLNLADKYYNSNVYITLYEQKNFATYDKAIEMIFKSEKLREEINGADWSEYSGILCPNASVILKDADKLSVYNSYNDNQKNEVNKIIVESAPFDTFTTLRSAFDAAVTKYAKSLVDNGNGGGGGGGGAPSRIPDSFGIGTEITQETQSSTNELFTDMSQAMWAQTSVQKLYNMGIVSAAAQYRPHDNVKREEFVKMLVQLAGINTDGKVAQFNDVNGIEWYASYLAAAQEVGIIKGNDNGSFGVGAPITRQDMVVMALRTVEVMNKSLQEKNVAQSFTDSSDISEYATEAVSKMQSAGVVNGMGNGRFEPKGLANRAQAAVIICNLIDALV